LKIGSGKVDFRMVGVRSLILQAILVPATHVVWPIQRIAFYDVSATYTAASRPETVRKMFLHLLEDRLEFKTHWETRPLDVYTLTVPGGSSQPRKSGRNPNPASDVILRTDGGFHLVRTGAVQAFTVNEIIGAYSSQFSRPVEDMTGLEGFYETKNVVLRNAEHGWHESDFLAAIENQFGLHLTPETLATRVLVVDHLLIQPVSTKQ
jgi:uncharacterized protein (TIGR03435 family)